jgi:UDP-N-acetylglucosamine 2-epimerase
VKFVSIVGARPQFIKASPLSEVLRSRHSEVLVHTGQHYDEGMSAIFFKELGIREPDHNLGVGSGPHGAQTGAMLAGLERVMQHENPEAVIVYGDTNSTLAGALAAAKLGIPIAHVEAGLRSFNKQMAEEINRIVADHLSSWLFAPSAGAARQLGREGIEAGVEVVGDIMIDALRLHSARATPVSELGLSPRGYCLATVHRAENTDDPRRLASIMSVLGRLDRPVILPLHPRARKMLGEFRIAVPSAVRLLQPVGYLEMLGLEASAALILTDSGGVQKEAYFFGVPCLTLREETEWIETVEAGWNFVCGTQPDRILEAAGRAPAPGGKRPQLYGDGHAADRIVAALERVTPMSRVV